MDMDKNNTDIKPSTPLNVGKLPVLLRVEKPQLDMGKIPGVPIWSPEDENDGKDNKQGVCEPFISSCGGLDYRQSKNVSFNNLKVSFIQCLIQGKPLTKCITQKLLSYPSIEPFCYQNQIKYNVK